jgi:hypothetical protein
LTGPHLGPVGDERELRLELLPRRRVAPLAPGCHSIGDLDCTGCHQSALLSIRRPTRVAALLGGVRLMVKRTTLGVIN